MANADRPTPRLRWHAPMRRRPTIPTRHLLALLLAATAPLAPAQAAAASATASASAASGVRVPLAGFMANAAPSAEEQAALPLMLNFPPGYADRLIGSPQGRARIVGLPGDTAKLVGKPDSQAEDLERGMFIFSPAPDMKFDAVSRRFSGEDDQALVSKLSYLGATGIVVQRTLPAGAPVWQIAFELNGRHVFVAYLPPATPDGTVIRVSYKHPRVFGPADVATWQRFIDGLAP